MRFIKVLFLGLLVLAGSMSQAHAQNWEGRGYFNLNFGGQSQEQTFADTSTFAIYGEQAASAAGHIYGGGTLFDIAAGARVWRDFGIGLGYSSIDNKNEAVVSVRVPHPFLLGQSREATATATDLRHSENAVHLQLVWMMPLSDRIDLAVMAGPSFFSVRQDAAAPIRSRTEISDPAPFTSVTIPSLTVAEYKDSPVGGNIGFDVTYRVTRVSGFGAGFGVGVGLFARYAGASMDLPVPDGVTRSDTKLKVGGGQAGIGLRVRF